MSHVSNTTSIVTMLLRGKRDIFISNKSCFNGTQEILKRSHLNAMKIKPSVGYLRPLPPPPPTLLPFSIDWWSKFDFYSSCTWSRTSFITILIEIRWSLHYCYEIWKVKSKACHLCHANMAKAILLLFSEICSTGRQKARGGGGISPPEDLNILIYV